MIYSTSYRITDDNWTLHCRDQRDEDGLPCARPRTVLYGSTDAMSSDYGLVPMSDYPSQLIDPADYKDAIADAHARKRFPMYHSKATWKKKLARYNQNGLNYCWFWGICGAWMAKRGMEGLDTDSTILAPNTGGWTVNWANKGNTLTDAIKAMRQRGAASVEFVPNIHSLNPRTFKEGWEDDALKHRLSTDIYDTDPRNRSKRIQHCVTLLCAGIPLYIAYLWWGHALQSVGLEWDDQRNRLNWIDDNSHNEDDFIVIEGDRGVPDEAYGVPSTETVF